MSFVSGPLFSLDITVDGVKWFGDIGMLSEVVADLRLETSGNQKYARVPPAVTKDNRAAVLDRFLYPVADVKIFLERKSAYCGRWPRKRLNIKSPNTPQQTIT